MLRYALSNLRANATRLIATALAVVIGIGFLAAGLMLTDAMKDALVGNVDRRYANVDLVIEPTAAIQGMATSVSPDVLEQVRAMDGVEAAGELSGPVTLMGTGDGVLTSRSMGRAWIAEERLNPLTIDEGAAPEPMSGRDPVEVVVDSAAVVVVVGGSSSPQPAASSASVAISTVTRRGRALGDRCGVRMPVVSRRRAGLARGDGHLTAGGGARW